MKVLLLPLFILFAATIATQSQVSKAAPDPFATDAGPHIPRMIRVHAEFIEMPHATFTELMAAPRHRSNDSDLRAQCAQLITDQKAHMIESLCVNALPDQTATSEAFAEYIYPTEPPAYDMPPVKGGFQFKPRPIGSMPVHSAFDTKNTGPSFEIDAQIDNSLPLVDLRLTSNIVYLSDQLVWESWEKDDLKVENSHPLFYVLSTKTGATLIAGEPHMIAAHSPQNDKGFFDPSRKIMLFLRADIIEVKK